MSVSRGQANKQANKHANEHANELLYVPLALERHDIVAPRGEKLRLKSSLANERAWGTSERFRACEWVGARISTRTK